MKIVKVASRALAVALCFGAFTGASSAATTISFMLPGSVTAGVGSSIGAFSQNGIDGSIHANGGCWLCNPVITQDAAEGLGVSSHKFDDPAIDGALTWESLTFEFNSAVELLSIEFGWLDNEDDWTIVGQGGTFVATGSNAVYNFASGTTATLLSVFATDTFEANGCAFSIHGFCVWPTGGPDDFSVKSITVQSAAPAPVPLPAAVWLFGSAVAGLGAAAWRRRARSA